MSGGVDSSVAASLLRAAGHEVVGATLKLWGGDSDSGCCSVSDVDDARRVAEQIGIAHHVFNFTDDFDAAVVAPYVADHAAGRTPNPCIECNRHIKFGTLLERSRRLGFDALATGHHARVTGGGEGRQLRRGADRAKDQSYVLSMLTQAELAEVVLPVGEMTKAEVRAHAAGLGLRTADKPDSQEVCFIQSKPGRRGFLGDRVALHTGHIVDARSGAVVGTVPAVELVTVGQRRGLGVAIDGRRLYALSVDVDARRVLVGPGEDAVDDRVAVVGATWIDRPLDVGARTLVQTSAHGRVSAATWLGDAVLFDQPQVLVAPGQTVALYDTGDGDAVVGSALAA
jgi:tRNA-uridine 2-sulfurtransferase